MSFTAAAGGADSLELRSIVVWLGIDLFWKRRVPGAAVVVEHPRGVWLTPRGSVCLVE